MPSREPSAAGAVLPEAGSKQAPDADSMDVLGIDDSRYRSLMAKAAEARSRLVPSDAKLSAEVAPYLFWEARLLDDRRYRAWLALLAADFVYWVPSDPDAGHPTAQSAVSFDDRRRMVDRIALIETGIFVSQTPPSRTCRIVTNIEAWPGADQGVDIRSNVMVWDHRRGRTTCYVGWQSHQLVPGGERWLIRSKVINLLDCDRPQGNLTFIL